MTKKTKVKTSISIPLETKQRLDKEAVQRNSDGSRIIVEALNLYWCFLDGNPDLFDKIRPMVEGYQNSAIRAERREEERSQELQMVIDFAAAVLTGQLKLRDLTDEEAESLFFQVFGRIPKKLKESTASKVNRISA